MLEPMDQNTVVRPPAHAAAYGGPSWPARETSLVDELGSVWSRCGIDSEYATLRAVLLHRPGAELFEVEDADQHLMLEAPDAALCGAQHDAMADAYRENGVQVVYVDPGGSGAATGGRDDARGPGRGAANSTNSAPSRGQLPIPGQVPPPNQMFCADLFVMTPSGAIVGRPASTVRAGEERWIARRLADCGVPILRSVGGRGTFEGADLCWLAPGAAMIGRGLRTNTEGAAQVAATLAEIGVETLVVDLPHTSMHLMGEVRFADRDLAFARPGRIPWTALEALREHGYEVRFFPDDHEMVRGFGHNFVTLGPRRVLMPRGCPLLQAAYEDAGVECVTVEMAEIHKCAGGIGCLSGVVTRERVAG